MDKGDRFATVSIKNTGDASGQYTIETVDMMMEETGNIREANPDEPVEFSAKEMVRVSPRSMTLAPGEFQNIRVLVRKPAGLADGEYRTHIKVRMLNDNVEASEADAATQKGIQVKTNLVLVIPAIIRHGETSYTVKLTGAKLVNDPLTKSVSVQLYINRDGNRSSMGDLRVSQASDGKEIEIGTLAGVPVYRPNARRMVSVPLNAPPASGKIKISYSKQEKEGGGVLAETSVEP